jgi:hypothetical protein
MATWYESSLLTEELQEQFTARWMLAGGPKDAAVFAVYDPKAKRMVCYINPAMATLFPDLVEAAASVPCEPQSGLPLLIGDQHIVE